MSIIINIASDIEQRLVHLAQKKGIEVEDYVNKLIEEKVAEKAAVALEEDELLQKINQGLSATVWERFHALVAKRDNYTLTEEEYQELNAISDRIETAHAERMKYVVQLAQLRAVGLDEVMDSLQIPKPTY